MRSLTFAAVAVVLLHWNLGCSSDPSANLSYDQTSIFQVSQASLAQDIEKRVNRDRDQSIKQFNALALSGGAAYGAWGAGWLVGWQKATNPTFDVVTGISTGALQATAAFVGGEVGNTTLEKYANVTTDQIYEPKWFVLIDNSLMETKPLGILLKTLISDQIISQVAQISRKEHRKLYVATVDLQTGKLVTWDLTKIAEKADSDPVMGMLYRRVVLASAAIPVIFPPVDIGGHQNVDGGTGALVFYRNSLAHQVAAAKSAFMSRLKLRMDMPAERRKAENQLQFNLYMIVNGTLEVSTSDFLHRIWSLGFRAIDCLNYANNMSSLSLTALIAKDGGYQCFLSYIPDDAPKITDSTKFIPLEMKPLFDAGEKAGHIYATSRPWMPEPSGAR